MFGTHLLIRSLCLLFGTVICFSEHSHSVTTSESEHGTRSPSKPNFIFIITDDQDLHLSSLDYMPLVQKHLGEQGTFYKRHYCTIAICCPSRVSLLTGKAAHNTNVTDVAPPYGGYPKFISQGLNDKYLPVWLQEAGYNTYYTGKLMNGHSTSTYNKPFAGGWNGSDFLIDPGTYLYWNATFQRNTSPPSNFPNDYNTDLINSKALAFLDDAVKASGSKPFFVGIAPIAPHAVTQNGAFTPPDPAPRHQDLFPGLKAPRTSNFNPEEPSGASWIFNLERLNDTEIEYHDLWYRTRIQSLQAVDEIVDNVVNYLSDNDLLDNTYIIYTSDNGFHIGQHRLQPGKTCAFEEDINVPFYIRGPGVEAGRVVDLVTTHTDIVPTLFDLAGIELREDFDGKPFPVTRSKISEAETKNGSWSEHVNVEFWGKGIQEGKFSVPGVNNTYKALRISGEGYNIMYSVWCTNEHELYDMTTDPGQLNNLARSSTNQTQLLNRPVSTVQSRLDTLLLVLKTCKAASCTDPWSVLHPQGDVTSLEQALSEKYDTFYEAQPRVSYSKCELGQILSSEGPLVGNVYNGSMWPNWHLGGNAQWLPGPEVTNIASDVPEGCTVDLAAFFSRHGSRYPDTGAYKQWTDLQAHIQNSSFDTTSPSLAFLKTWKPVLSDPDRQIAQISPTGYKELTDMGATWRLRYADLYAYDSNFTLWSNYYKSSPRVRDSARMFAQGFLGPRAGQLGTIYALNASDPASWMNSLAPSDLCPAYNDEGGSPYTDEWQNIYLPPIQRRINALISGNLTFSQSEISIIPYLCGFETQITGRRSPFCDVFTEEEILQYEYAQDLRYWYGTGLGSDIEKLQMLPVLDMLVRRFVDGPDATYTTSQNTTFTPPRIMASFSNDGQINQLIAATGVFDGEPQLPGDRMLKDRRFRASRLTPMRGTVAFERLTCVTEKVVKREEEDCEENEKMPAQEQGYATPGKASTTATVAGYSTVPASSQYSTTTPTSPGYSKTPIDPGYNTSTPAYPPAGYNSTTPTAPGYNTTTPGNPGNGTPPPPTTTTTTYIRVLFNDVVYPVTNCTSGPGSSCPLAQYEALVKSKLAAAGSFTELCNATSGAFASEPRATWMMDDTLSWASVLRP